MSIVLSVAGQLTVAEKLSRIAARDWLARAAVWFESIGDAVLDARVGRDAEDKPVLLVVFHPAVPPVELRLGGSGKLRVYAITCPAGPGYHIFLCNLLRQMADDFALTWIDDDCSDPTGYFQTQQRAVCEQRFLASLSELCAAGPAAVGLPPDHGFTYPAEVLTPVGPRTRAWCADVAADPAKGRDFFPWWNPQLDAAFYRGRALVRLWCEFFWRPPLTEDEGEVADQIANDLASAFKLDPAIELPWGEWLELLASIENDTSFCVTPKDRVLSIELWKRAGPPPVVPGRCRMGYRRWPVRVRLEGGWQIEVPGELAREWNRDEQTWTAWDQTRTVWFQVLRFTKRDGEPPSAEEAADVGRRSLPDGEELPPIIRPGLRGEAVFGVVEEDGRKLWRLSSVTGVRGQLAVCNIYIEKESDRDWAMRTWHSLHYNPDQAP